MPTSDDIRHQQNLLEIHRRNLALLVRQYNLQGGAAYATPVVVNGLHENREEIKRLKTVLRAWGVVVEDQPDDEEPPREVILPAPARPASASVTNNYYGNVHQQSGGTNVSSTFNQQDWQVQGDVYNIARDLNIGANPNKNDLLKALRQLQHEVAKAEDLPTNEADDVKTNVEAAMKAVDKAEPDTHRAAKKLGDAKQILDGFGQAIPSALALGKLIGQALTAVGVAL